MKLERFPRVPARSITLVWIDKNVKNQLLHVLDQPEVLKINPTFNIEDQSITCITKMITMKNHLNKDSRKKKIKDILDSWCQHDMKDITSCWCDGKEDLSKSDHKHIFSATQ